MPILRLLICDRHRLFRQGLARQLGAIPNFQVVADAATSAEVLRFANQHRPAVVLLDLGVTAPSGFEVVRVLNAKLHPPAVIVVSERTDLPHLLAAHYAGAAGYVPKDADLDRLTATITRVAAHPTRLSLEQVHELHQRYGQLCKKLPAALPGVSERHEQLLKLLVEGRSNREIAALLHVKEKTVRNELSHLYRKLGVRNRTEAALVAVRAFSVG